MKMFSVPRHFFGIGIGIAIDIGIAIEPDLDSDSDADPDPEMLIDKPKIIFMHLGTPRAC